MALTQYTADTDIIETLGTNPEDRPTLTDNTFKAKFDENSANIAAFLNAMIAELASTANGKGASQIGIEDSASKITATTVEAALAEFATLISTKVNPNALINGCFRINQRVKSGTVTLAAGVYGHDRWKAGASGCTYTFATSGGVTTITITAGSLIQVIEGQNLETATYCLSWAGTATGKIGAGSLSASGVTGSVTGGSNLSIEFGTGTLSKVKFEKGTVATPFIMRTFAEEINLCQRYYRKSYTYGAIAGTATETGSFNQWAISGWYVYSSKVIFDNPMRTSPTVTLYSINSADTTGVTSEYNGGGTFVADRASTTTEKNEKGFIISASGGAYTTGNNIKCHWVADSEI